MKYIIIICFELIIFIGAAQTHPYSQVVELDSTYTSSQLFSAAKKWFAVTYKSSKAVVRFQCIIMIGAALLPFGYTTPLQLM
jgi:hypothetical protein